jgi:hypothetical protein
MCQPLAQPGEMKEVDPKTWFDQYKGTYSFQGLDAKHSVVISKNDENILATVDNDAPFTVVPCGDAICFYQRHTPGPKEVIRFSKDEQKHDVLEIFGEKLTKDIL